MGVQREPATAIPAEHGRRGLLRPHRTTLEPLQHPLPGLLLHRREGTVSQKCECLVRYDNETGKGDHRHYGAHEEPYRFVSLARLIDDFLADV